MNNKIPTGCCFFVCLIFGGVLLLAYAFQQPVSQSKLDKLRNGMSQEEVQAILGSPTERYDSGQWTYTRRLVFGYVNLRWDDEGKLEDLYNFERF